MDELVKRDSTGELTPMELIGQMARDPAVDVSKLEALMALKERVDARDARAAFWAAMARLSTKLPRIKKNGTISLGQGKGAIPYAKYEDIDTLCRPLLAEEGLMASFSTRVNAAGGVTMVLTVAHKDGHSETSERPAPPDTGPGRNATQAQGSGESYAKRYLFNAFFNVVTLGADDDGRATGFITDAQKQQILDMLHQCGSTASPKVQDDFLRYMGVAKVGEINSSDFRKAMSALEAKYRKMQEGAR